MIIKIMKKLAIIIISVTLILCIAIGVAIVSLRMFNTGSFTRGTVIFKYGDQDIREAMSEEDCRKIRDIFSNKILHKDDPSCGFSEDISVRFKDGSGETITCCIAQDTCRKVYISEKKRYVDLSEKEAKEFRNILEKYGMTFPCI